MVLAYGYIHFSDKLNDILEYKYEEFMISLFSFFDAVFFRNKKYITIILLTIVMIVCNGFIMLKNGYAAEPNTITNNNKTLIVYYSRSGNTDTIAQYINNQTGADVIKLETVQPYPEQYRATTIQAKKELEEDFYPELKTKINNIADYDVILIGSPNWWGTLSMPIRTFLHETNLSNKQIALFITHEGSGLGRSIDDLKKFQPNVSVLDSIAIRGSNVNSSQQQIQQWINKLGINK